MRLGSLFSYPGDVRFSCNTLNTLPISSSLLFSTRQIHLSSVTGSARNPFGSGKPFGVRQTAAPAATGDLPTALRTKSRFPVLLLFVIADNQQRVADYLSEIVRFPASSVMPTECPPSETKQSGGTEVITSRTFGTNSVRALIRLVKPCQNQQTALPGFTEPLQPPAKPGAGFSSALT